jgi:hypothetical protein
MPLVPAGDEEPQRILLKGGDDEDVGVNDQPISLIQATARLPSAPCARLMSRPMSSSPRPAGSPGAATPTIRPLPIERASLANTSIGLSDIAGPPPRNLGRSSPLVKFPGRVPFRHARRFSRQPNTRPVFGPRRRRRVVLSDARRPNAIRTAPASARSTARDARHRRPHEPVHVGASPWRVYHRPIHSHPSR